MSHSLIEALCQIKGARLAARLYPFLIENDPDCFVDDDSFLVLVQQWEYTCTAELASSLNGFMVEKTKSYLELNLVDTAYRKYIREMLNYHIHYDVNRPNLSSFSITFDGFKYTNPDKKALKRLADFIVNVGDALKIQIFPSFYFTLYMETKEIEQLRSIDKSIVEIPYNRISYTKTFLMNMDKNEHFDAIMERLSTYNQSWGDEIRCKCPAIVLLIDNLDGELPKW